jgi:predicted secreted protein
MLNLKFALNHFFHQRKAKNRHGLHSPFVYRLVDEVIYDFLNKKVYAEIEKTITGGKKLKKTDKLLYRLVADAKAQTVWVLGKSNAVNIAVIKHACVQVINKNIDDIADWKDIVPPDVLFLDVKLNPQTSMDYFNRALPKLHPQSFLIVNGLPENSLTKTSWSIMISHKKVTASVNLFWLGLIYFRPGQVKENFYIKF